MERAGLRFSKPIDLPHLVLVLPSSWYRIVIDLGVRHDFLDGGSQCNHEFQVHSRFMPCTVPVQFFTILTEFYNVGDFLLFQFFVWFQEVYLMFGESGVVLLLYHLLGGELGVLLLLVLRLHQ